MRLFITGATGFIGAAVVTQSLAAGHEVAVVLRDPSKTGRLIPGASAICCYAADLRDSERVATALNDFRPEAVLHLAWAGVANTARNDLGQVFDNVLPTCQLLKLAAHAGASKFVGLGSQGEYGPLNKIIVETDRPRPTTLYGVAKLTSSMICQKMASELGIAFAWLRLFSTYGPGDSEVWMIPSLIAQLLRKERPQTTAGTQIWDYLFIDDVANAVIATAQAKEAVGVFNLGSGQPVLVRRIIETIRELVDPDADVGIGEIPFRSDQVMHMQADNARLRSLTKWQPKVTLDEGLARTVADMRHRCKTETSRNV